MRTFTKVAAAAVLAVGLLPGMASGADAQVAPELTLVGDTIEHVSGGCTGDDTGVFEFLVTGTAVSGTATGTFSETVTLVKDDAAVIVPDFHAEFTAILDDGRTISGEKSLPAEGASWGGGMDCSVGVGEAMFAIVVGSEVPYTATTTDASGTSSERGVSVVTFDAAWFAGFGPVLNASEEMFTPTHSGPSSPTTADQCKDGGWATFTELGFRNQGDCVSYVVTGGKNEPGKNTKK